MPGLYWYICYFAGALPCWLHLLNMASPDTWPLLPAGKCCGVHCFHPVPPDKSYYHSCHFGRLLCQLHSGHNAVTRAVLHWLHAFHKINYYVAIKFKTWNKKELFHSVHNAITGAVLHKLQRANIVKVRAVAPPAPPDESCCRFLILCLYLLVICPPCWLCQTLTHGHCLHKPKISPYFFCFVCNTRKYENQPAKSEIFDMHKNYVGSLVWIFLFYLFS